MAFIMTFFSLVPHPYISTSCRKCKIINQDQIFAVTKEPEHVIEFLRRLSNPSKSSLPKNLSRKGKRFLFMKMLRRAANENSSTFVVGGTPIPPKKLPPSNCIELPRPTGAGRKPILSCNVFMGFASERRKSSKLI